MLTPPPPGLVVLPPVSPQQMLSPPQSRPQCAELCLSLSVRRLLPSQQPVHWLSPQLVPTARDHGRSPISTITMATIEYPQSVPIATVTMEDSESVR